VLLEVIEQYRQEQGLNDLQLAARRWFVDVFRPLWQTIRAREYIAQFAGDRSADLIARVAQWRAEHDPSLDWPTALTRFVEPQRLTGTGTDNVSSRKG
jgi:hypothetical protein